MIGENRIFAFRDVVENDSITKDQFENRSRILSRIFRYIKESSSDEELYGMLLTDFPAWSAFFLNGDNGKPLFLAKWQVEYASLLDTFPKVWAFCTRKTGKSTLLSAKTLHSACKNDNKRIICLAPTKKQVFVFDDIRRFLNESEFLTDMYIAGGGKNVAEEVALTNRSRILRHTIGIQSGGALIRGEKGDTIVIDEVQLIEREIMSSVIKPILWDTYSQKSLDMIGTPSLLSNPELNIEWDAWRKCENYECQKPFIKPYQLTCGYCGSHRERSVYHIGWERGVREGCISYDQVQKDMKSMTPDEIDMELNAVFPTQSGRFFPMQILFDCGKDYRWGEAPTRGKDYIMSVDWGKMRDRTEILIAEVRGDEMWYVYHHRIDPKKGIVDYDDQYALVKSLFHTWDVKWLIADATSHQDAHVEAIMKGDHRIPGNRMRKDDKDRFGYKATDVSNYDMWRNHRQLMSHGKLRYPRTDPVFRGDWVREHNQLSKKPIRSGTLLKLVAPKNGFKDLAVCSAMLSLYLFGLKNAPPLFDVYVF